MNYNYIMDKTLITKKRLIKVLEIFNTYSDENHPISIDFIIQKLQENNINTSKYALYDDIKTLIELNYEIIFQRNIGYYLISKYDITELKILIDALCSTNFLSIKKTNQLINNVLENTSIYNREILKNNLIYNPNKITNDKIIYNIHELLDNIQKDQAITFKYFDLDITKNKKYRKNNKSYKLIPYALVIHNQFYYCIGYNQKYQNLQHYRIDKMDKIISQEKVEKLNLNISEYTNRLFDMYVSTMTNVTLRCDLDLANVIYDNFNNIIITNVNEKYFEVNINIDPSITFISWLFTFKNKIKVLKPQSLIDEINNTLEIISDIYK